MTLQELLDKRNHSLSEARSYMEKNEPTPEDEVAYQRAFEAFQKYDRLFGEAQQLARADAEAAEARAQVEELLQPKEIRAQESAFGTEVREFLTPGSPRKTLFIPVPEARHDIIKSDGGANAYGSYTIPTTWWNQLQYHVNAQSGLLASNVTVLRTTTGEDMYVPTFYTDASATITADGTAATQTIPVFSRQALPVYRVDGYFSVSKEFLEDSAINGVEMVQNAASRAIATALAAYAAAGTASSQPSGLNYTTELSTAGKTAASDTTFTMDELWDLYLSVLPGYRARGEWVVGTTAYSIIMKMKDDEGRYLISDPTANEPARLIGKALREDADFQACTTAKCPVVFGDMSTFWTRYARGMEFSRDDSFAFTSFEATFRFAVWFGCNLIDRTGSIKHLLLA